jgi:hypothetical protein
MRTFRHAISVFLPSIVMGSLAAQTNTEVVFQCDMNVQITLGQFDPSSAQVVVRGELNAWGCSAPMTDDDGDGIYEIVLPRDNLAPGSYPYKFNVGCLDSGWEGGGDRLYTVTGSETDTDGNGYVEVTTHRYFDDIDTPGKDTEVLFRCDMNVQISLGVFTAGVDTVHLRGEINGWGCTEMTDDDGDGVYEVSVQKTGVAPKTYGYKFNIDCGDHWESGDNRFYTITGSEADADGDGFVEASITRFFDDIDSATPTHDVDLRFRCDMSAQITLGRFVPGVDTLQLRGEINTWGCSEMADEDGDGVYEISFKLPGLPEKTYEYKFNINCGNLWEDGGNRQYTVDGTAPDTDGDGFGEITLLRFFNDTSPDDLLLSDVTVVFSVDLSSVRRALDAGRTIVPVQDHGGPIASFAEITSVGVTGPFAGWNWTQFTPQNLLVDDGTGFDSVAGDSIFTGAYVLVAGSSRDLTYKYSLNGYDNEAGFGNDHAVRIDGDAPELHLAVDCYGSLNTDPRLPFGSVDGAFGCGGASPTFARGDCNGDGRKDLSDAVFDLNHLFSGGRAPRCVEACNTNGDGRNDISDAVYLLGHLFLGGPPPGAPFPGCGAPPAPGLGCAEPTCTIGGG